MPSSFKASSVGSQDTKAPRLTYPSFKASTLLRITRYFFIFSPAIFLLASSTTAIKSAIVLPAAIATDSPATRPSAEQNAQHNASLIRANLTTYLNFVGSEVLPVMSKNIDEILHNLTGLTDIRPGFFYHGHIDYSTYVSGGIDRLMEMNNVVLQYHTLENPPIYVRYWRDELGNIDDQKINAWVERIREYNRAVSTPSAASGVQYTPLIEYEAIYIASRWGEYRNQNRLASPGLEMLIKMVYLVDGGRQPLYQESFREINRFHSIAFSREEYVQLDNRTHLENTFSPFQITFEHIGKCHELLSLFEEASAREFGYILNISNAYVVQQPERMNDADMAKLSIRLNDAISDLPDDNLIKMSNTPNDQQIAFFAVGNYIFAVYGSLDPPIFK